MSVHATLLPLQNTTHQSLATRTSELAQTVYRVLLYLPLAHTDCLQKRSTPIVIPIFCYSTIYHDSEYDTRADSYRVVHTKIKVLDAVRKELSHTL